MRISLFVLSLSLCLASHAPAQQPLVTRSLDSASVVRLRLASGQRVHAVLLSPFTSASDAVTFRPFVGDCGVPRAVCRIRTPSSEVRTIEVARGNRAGRGALIGGMIGGMIGLWLSAVGSNADYAPCPPPSVGGGCGSRARTPSALLTTVAGAALGAGVGALFGRGSPSWEPAP